MKCPLCIDSNLTEQTIHYYICYNCHFAISTNGNILWRGFINNREVLYKNNSIYFASKKGSFNRLDMSINNVNFDFESPSFKEDVSIFIEKVLLMKEFI